MPKVTPIPWSGNLAGKYGSDAVKLGGRVVPIFEFQGSNSIKSFSVSKNAFRRHPKGMEHGNLNPPTGLRASHEWLAEPDAPDVKELKDRLQLVGNAPDDVKGNRSVSIPRDLVCRARRGP